MFGLFSRQEPDKELSLPFKVVLEAKDDGLFLARIPELPGCVARGRARAEALENAKEAIRLHLEAAATATFDVVWENLNQRVVNGMLPFFGRLVGVSNRDGSVVSHSGDYGSWVRGEVSRAGKGKPRRAGEEDELEEADGLLDFTPQVYCAAIFGGAGVPKLYAGTSANGAIYESVDGASWELSTATGEERVHCLCEFKGRLYAGTSASGKLFCYTGAHWSLVHRGTESALTSACAFRGELFIGSYPNGHIYASADGVNWHLAFDSGQTFVRALVEHEGCLYAATSKASGGAVFRSDNGLRWEKVFESRDPNFYCLHSFAHSLWLGTGNNGRLYRSLDGSAWTLAATLEDEGIRALASYDGRLFLGTEGRGRIYRSRFADTPPPAISEVRVHDVTSHSAVVSWRTDRPADSRAQYGVEHLTESVHSTGAVTEHRVALGHLRSRTRYSLQLVSRCPDFSEAGFSGEISFTTGGAETAEATSASHPDDAWSRLNEGQFSWNAPEGVVRFHWCVDRLPDTLPVEGQNGVRSTTERAAAFGPLEDGVWWFHLRCEDRAGNLGAEAYHRRLRVDTVALAPRLSSPSHPENAWSNKTKAALALEAPPDLSGVAGYYTLLDRRRSSVPTADSGTWCSEPKASVELSEDGEWWFHAVTVDAAGNVGTDAAHYLLRLDRRAEPPEIESPSHPDPARWFNTSQMLLTWSEPADLSGIAGYYHILDQRPETLPTPETGAFTLNRSVSFEGRTDGVWWFHVVSVDAAGNVGTEAAHRCLRVDTWAAAPEVVSPTHPAGTWVSANRVLFEITPPEDMSGTVGYLYLLDKERASIPSSERGTFTSERTLEFTGLADGLWHLHVVSKDAAGNVGVEATHVAVRVDTEALPPRVTSTTHPQQDDWSRQKIAEMVWDPPEDLSGIADYYWLLDAEPDTVPTAYSGTRCNGNHARVEVPDEGVWFFHIVSADRAGNVGRVAAHHKLKVDIQARPPRLICPTHPDRLAWSSHTRPRFEWFEPEDSSGIVGYYWLLDREESTVPAPAGATYTTERYAVMDRGVESDGLWWFHVVSRDRAGNVGQEASHYPVRIDTTALPPALRSPTHPDRHAWSNNPNPVFEWSPPDDPSGVAGYYYVLNRNQTTIPTEATGTWTEDTRAAFAGLEDGVWTLHIVAKDRVGNVGVEAAHYSVRIDTQALPPQVTSPTHPEGAWTRNAAPTFVWTPPADAAGVAGYYYCIDREAVTVPTPEKAQFTTATMANFSRLEDGVWVFHIVTADAAGNVGNRAAHHSIHIDTSAGVAEISCSSHPDGERWYKNPHPTLTWTSPQDPSGISGYFWCVDQQATTVPGLQSHWTPENQASPGPLPDGEWWFHVCTKDGAGNLSEEAAHYRLRIDTYCPRPRIYCKNHADADGWMGSGQPIFFWEDGEDASGIDGHFWIFDRSASAPLVPGKAQWTATDSLTLPPQEDGVWTFALAARDHAGNVSEPSRLTLRIETQPPVSRLEALPAFTSSQSFELRWKGEDLVSGVAYYDLELRETGESEWKPWLTRTTATSAVYTAKDGVEVAFRVRAVDKAGNAEPFDPVGPWVSTLVDFSPPDAVVNLVAKPGPAGSVQLSWSPALDAGSGTAGYEVWRSTSEDAPGVRLTGEGGISRPAFVDPGKDLEDGALYHYTVAPFDKAGNHRRQGNATVACRCDRTAPIPSLSSETHPDPQAWSAQSRALVRWDEPSDLSGVAGYYWTLDQSLDSVPNPRTAQFTAKTELELNGLKDGIWHLHVVCKDLAGNVSEAARWRFNIDTTAPGAPQVRCATHHPDSWTRETKAVFEWNEPTDVSGIAGYRWVFDASPNTVPGAGEGQYIAKPTVTVEGVGDGVWYFHVVAVDRAGNLGTQAGHARVQVTHAPPPPAVVSPTHPRPGEIYGGRTAVFQWSTPAYSQGIPAWLVRLDQNPDTVPGHQDVRTTELRHEVGPLDAGDWWFHIVSEGEDGALGNVAGHFLARIRTYSSLQGQVTKPNGMLPLEGASVEIVKAGASVAKTTTGKDGRFRFEDLEPGPYQVRLEVPGAPELLIEGPALGSAPATLNLSADCMAWPNPTAGAKTLRFAMLAKEAGAVTVKVYRENGQGIGQTEVVAEGAGWVFAEWDCTQAPAGGLLWQASIPNQGKILKYPIRKLQISG